MAKSKRRGRPPGDGRRLVGLRALREKAGLDQIDLADRLGVDKSTVSHWEKLKNGAPYPRLCAMAQLLDCTVDDLFRDAA